MLAGRDEQRLKEMVTLANRKLGDLSALAKEPSATFALLDRFVRNNIMAAEADRLSLAFILDQASYVFPAGEPGRLSAQASSQLVTMLNWAMSPHVKRLNMAFVLLDEKLADLSERLTGNPHVAAIEVPLPDEAERERFVQTTVDAAALASLLGLRRRGLARLTAGISLTDLNVLVQSARESGRRLDAAVFRDDEEAADRAAVPRPARVHRAEVDARHGRGPRRGQGAAARGCGAPEARRARQPADGVSDLRPGRDREVVSRTVRERRDRRRPA